mmetsp:Transcript_30899/g.51151  ORF Transcript_30899/g.51151 Transcript_30899/m.51151 type:complete len:146 (-) Transcript_30899:1020-1457(-)
MLVFSNNKPSLMHQTHTKAIHTAVLQSSLMAGTCVHRTMLQPHLKLKRTSARITGTLSVWSCDERAPSHKGTWNKYAGECFTSYIRIDYTRCISDKDLLLNSRVRAVPRSSARNSHHLIKPSYFLGAAKCDLRSLIDSSHLDVEK